MNEAALNAARYNQKVVRMHDFEFAKDKVLMGSERRSMIISDAEKRVTAIHEAGHALLTVLLPHADPIHKVTIIPRGMALGLTQQLPADEKHNYSREYLNDQIAILLGGRIAEEITMDSLTTGAGNDLERATELARRMVCEWGMSDAMGPLTFGKKEEQIFLGREIAQHQDYSEDTALKIDQEVKRFVTDNYHRAHVILRENKETLVKIADALLAREVLDAEQVRRLAAGLPLDDPRPAAARPAVAEEDEARPRQKERTPIVPAMGSLSRRSSAATFPPRALFTVPLARRRGPPSRGAAAGHGDPQRHPRFVCRDPVAARSGSAVDAALEMEAQGADLIDVGGESTRPGADPLAATDELARVLPVLAGLAGRLRVPLSVDTYKADVARAALDAGASLVNDVSGLRYDPALARVVAARGAAVVLMHTRGRPKTMYSEAIYDDVIAEVRAELKASVALAQEAGVAVDRILVDPGIGFAKRPEHSYGVLARVSELAEALARPVLVGPSRKSFMRHALDARPAAERDWGTAAAVTAAVLAGAHIVRVHAVKEMVQVVRVAEEIRRHNIP